jgi:signal transduction histidine kinase
MTNFGLFSGDDELGAAVVRRLFEQVIRLRGKRLVVSECGHGYRSTICECPNWAKMKVPFIMESSVITMLRYIKEGRIKVDPSRNKEPVTYHDSCNNARSCGMFEEPRELLRLVCTVRGETRHVLVYSAPILSEDGEVESVMEMSTDITPLRELQGKLEQIGLLIGSVSHSLKGLLTGLDGGIYLLKTGIEKNDMQRVSRGLQMMERNVQRVKAVVGDILYYAKERELCFEDVDACELTREVTEAATMRAKEFGIEIEVRMPETPLIMRGDRNALRAMLSNLVENATDACRVDKSKEAHKVLISVEAHDEEVVFGVSDNGIGMDKETMEKAFTLFFSSKGCEGTGLGLFIANKIALGHKGGIEVDSTPREGSKFRVILPRTNI